MVLYRLETWSGDAQPSAQVDDPKHMLWAALRRVLAHTLDFHKVITAIKRTSEHE